MRFTTIRSCTLPLVVVTAAWTAGPAASAEQSAGDAMELVTYEVGDLVVNVPEYFLNGNSGGTSSNAGDGRRGGMGGGMGGGGGGFFSVAEEPIRVAQFGGGEEFAGGEFGGEAAMGGAPSLPAGPGPITIASLTQVITGMVGPGTWAPQGEGQAAVLGTSLVVRQSQAVHRQIAALLNSLRSGSATRRTVAIDARWFMLDSDDLERLVQIDDKGVAKLDREFLGKVTRRATSLRGMTNCFSGQSVYLISGTLRSSVSSYIPVVGSVEEPRGPEIMFAVDRSDAPVQFVQQSGGRVGYQPVVTTNNFGVQIELRPTLMHSEKAAVVDLKSTITFPGSPSPAPLYPGAVPGASLAPQIDRLAIQTQELATTLRMPLGEPVLVGGMTYMEPAEGSPEATAAGGFGLEGGGSAADAGRENRQLYLVLELR